MSAFLSARGVSYRWNRRALVDDVTLDVALGSVTIVVGPNGAGKSTLLRLLSGELPPSAGAILCDGAAIAREPPWRLACKRAVMTQAMQLSFPFTVYEVARLGLDGIGKGLSPHRREALVAQCLVAGDVSHLAQRRYHALSGGEQRRVQFARALAQIEAGRSVNERQALLLDEPVANLDLRHQLALLDAARAAADRGLAVVIVLHDLNLALRYADVLAVMRDGAIVACGAPAVIVSADMLSDVFGVELNVAGSPRDGWYVAPSRWVAPETGRSGS